MTVEENKYIARRAFEAMQAGDLGPIGDLLTTDAVIHQCGFLEPIPVRRLIGDAGTPSAFPGGGRIAGRRVRLERMIGEDDLVALHWTATGQYVAPDEPEIDGRPVSVPWMTFLRIEDGLIAEIWNIQDTATLQSQLREPAGSVGRR